MTWQQSHWIVEFSILAQIEEGSQSLEAFATTQLQKVLRSEV